MMAGSNQMVSLLLMIAIFLSLKRGHDGAAGVLLGLQLFKPQLAIAIFVVLAFKRRWRALAGFGAVALLWALLSMLFVSGGALVDYLQVIPTLARLAFVEGFPLPYLSQFSLRPVRGADGAESGRGLEPAGHADQPRSARHAASRVVGAMENRL